MSSLKRRVAKLEDKTGINKPSVCFIVVNKRKGETPEAKWDAYKKENPDADRSNRMMMII